VGKTPAPVTHETSTAPESGGRVASNAWASNAWASHAWANNVAFETQAARILTWNNVVLQAIAVADLSYINSLGAVFRRQLRAYPKGLVSFVVFPRGFQPAPQPVRQAMSRLLEETEGSIHHVLVVENAGLASQLLVTVIRGVLVLGGRSSYALPGSRAEGVAATLRHVTASASSNLAGELESALAYCCGRL
jgi:hypothetical protein